MKKSIYLILVFAIFTSLLVSSCGASANTSAAISTSSPTSGTAFVPMTQEETLAKLGNYLPKNVIDNLPDFRIEEGPDGSIVNFWSKKEPNSDAFLHKLSMAYDDAGYISYGYKNYAFVPDGNEITMDLAAVLVNNFAKDFITGYENLTFVNKTLPEDNTFTHSYDPGVVEAWVAENNGKQYVIFVNLELGYVHQFYTNQI